MKRFEAFNTDEALALYQCMRDYLRTADMKTKEAQTVQALKWELEAGIA